MTVEARGAVSRRTLLAGAAGVPLLGAAAACDSANTAEAAVDPFGITADRSLEVVIFPGGFGDDYAKAHEAMYRKEYPKAKVVHEATKTIATDMKPRFDSGEPPDVLNNDGADQFTIGELVNDGAMLDLTELLDSPSYDDRNVKVRDTLLPGTVESGTFNGKVYALNYMYTVFGLFYDAARWQSNGWEPPQTWDQFLALAPKIKAAGIAPFAHAGKYPYYMGWALADWIHKIGGSSVAMAIDNLEPGAWRHQAVLDAAGMVIDLVGRGFVMPGSETMSHTVSQQALIDGKCAMIPCGTWLENEMKATLPQSAKLTIVPVWSAGAKDAMPYGSARAGASGAFVVPTMAKNKAGGLEYLRVMLSKAGASKFSALTNSLASRKDSAEGVSGSSGLASAANVVKAAGNNLMTWKFSDWYGALEKAWEAAIADVMSGRTKRAADFAAAMQAAADGVARDSSITKFHRNA
ncbi:N-acetylglucosamine/diacetylchitobiose ABC transporter substrate-binding protein [Dactylosporangium salmoneum]|uniref:N-acetylglucosamine/diacetylchitobiose ABC transporter substrate-binding protein n=1 Tax=Dactylosporangium salmoneum TaxID=53361 RepID=A0ABP5UAC6_9ACTN